MFMWELLVILMRLKRKLTMLVQTGAHFLSRSTGLNLAWGWDFPRYLSESGSSKVDIFLAVVFL